MADIAELIVALRLQDGVSGGLGRLNTQLRGMDAGFAQMGRGFGQVGRGLDTLATRGAIAAAGLGTAFVTTASSMEEAFVGVQKTVDETIDVSFEELRQSLRDLSADTGTAFEELARIGEVGGALGVPIDQLEGFIDVINRIGVSTDLSVDEAAVAFGHLRALLDLNEQSIVEVADALVALGNAGASSEPEIIAMAERIAAAGNSAGLSNDEILALSSAMASMGLEAEAGGSSISRLFQNVTLGIATGSEEIQTFTDLMGISAAEFRERWETDALGTFQEFLGELNKLDQFEQANILDKAGINNVRDIDAIRRLAQNLDDVGIAFDAVSGKTGALNEESDKFFGTSAAGFRRLKENLRLAADTIGTEMLPVLNEVIGEFLTFLQDPATQRGIKDFAEDLAGGIRSFVDEIKAADFGPLIDTLKGAADIAKAGFDAFRALPPGVQSLALAAFGINKLTGGALGGIASGLGNIIGGGIKILFERGASPANPLWVQQVGGVAGAAAGAGAAGGGIGKLALGLTGVGLAGLLADEFEEEIQGLSESIHDSLRLPDLPGPSDWNWPLGSKNPPSWLPDFLGGPGPDMSNPFGLTPEEGRAALKEFVREGVRSIELGAKLLLPGFSEARNVTDRKATLPDTAMQPLTTAINGLKDAILREKDLTQGSQARNVTDRTERIFVDSVKLDTSQIQDLREPTRIAAEQLRVLIADSRAADTANRTANAFLTAEMSRNRAETANRLSVLAGKYDVQNANSSTANRVLSSINAKTPPTHPVTVNNSISIPVSISATLIEQRLVTARLASVGIPTAPTLL
jgi:TP901 family phage tail tape measure protein